MTDNLKASIIELNFLNISLLTYYVCCFSCPVLSERANQRVTQMFFLRSKSFLRWDYFPLIISNYWWYLVSLNWIFHLNLSIIQILNSRSNFLIILILGLKLFRAKYSHKIHKVWNLNCKLQQCLEIRFSRWGIIKCAFCGGFRWNFWKYWQYSALSSNYTEPRSIFYTSISSHSALNFLQHKNE